MVDWVVIYCLLVSRRTTYLLFSFILYLMDENDIPGGFHAYIGRLTHSPFLAKYR